MNNLQWNKFFEICASNLGEGAICPKNSDNWCAWTTFERLELDVKYWNAGLPLTNEFNETFVKDGGIWGQPFAFESIAHIIIPRKFYWESFDNGEYNSGVKAQNVDIVSKLLTSENIKHRCTELLLELKLY
ncbi:MAG: hypothetical protein GY787_07165 [Alteromonadales bacterium]|nr:hypothetical protein [Alteromonadales bacterium]